MKATYDKLKAACGNTQQTKEMIFDDKEMKVWLAW